MRRLITLALALTLLVSSAGPATQASADEGLKVFLASTLAIDPAAHTVTLPLREGRFGSAVTWFIITEASDRDTARSLGVNWSPKLANALGTDAVQTVTTSGGLVSFAGTVDFSPTRTVVPSATGFPPLVASPGAVGDPNYSPLITIGGSGIVLNAPQVKNASGEHDRLLSVDLTSRRITLRLADGFYHDNPIFYISTEASVSVVAALERATFAPRLNAAPGVGSNDPDTSARASIIPIVNGQTGATNPQRQGLQSALLDGLDPLNITIAHPGGENYSPLWDVHPAVWTDAAIASGQRVRLTHHDKVAENVQDGFITSGGDGPANSDLGGLRAAGFLVNCPIMAMRS